MISFREYLTEVRSAGLFHGTSIWAAQKILKENLLKAIKSDVHSPKSVSFTRSIEFAKNWVNSNMDLDISEIAVFEINKQKLNQNYKISPFNFWDSKTRELEYDHPSNEYEERVERSITNFDKYIEKIIVFVKPGRAIKGNLLLNHPKLYYNGKFVNK